VGGGVGGGVGGVVGGVTGGVVTGGVGVALSFPPSVPPQPVARTANVSTANKAKVDRCLEQLRHWWDFMLGPGYTNNAVSTSACIDEAS
jgi:hypothetical protein